ncbi:MAG TPA: hypothetical protein PKA21_09720 [Kiritimatiellia bacterium]|nr:hypothetical protein [Kiritimatiellia bacterium]HMP97886.1 hypothetical protein [Kiritimatiellia bacterium]
MPLPNQRGARSGATLVELLVALGIGALVIVVVVMAHQALTRETSVQSARLAERDLAEHTLRLLRDDLQGLFHPPGDADAGIALENTATNLVQLSFVRWERRPHGEPMRTNRLERVRYAFVAEGDQRRLVTVVEPLLGPDAGSPRTNWPGATWPRLTVHLHDGSSWQTNWTADSKTTPLAARVRLWGDHPTQAVHEAFIVIPAGLTVTSRIVRAGAGGALAR